MIESIGEARKLFHELTGMSITYDDVHIDKNQEHAWWTGLPYTVRDMQRMIGTEKIFYFAEAHSLHVKFESYPGGCVITICRIEPHHIVEFSFVKKS